MMARILVVEDEPALIQFLRSYLTRQGHEVLCAMSGADVLSGLEYEPQLDLAVIDHWLPDISGFEVAKKLWEAQPGLRVLISSGAPIGLEELESLSPGQVLFLQKPYSPRMLLEALRNSLDPRV